MSLIDDVREEINGLDLSIKSLRKFGLMVGGVFLLLTFLLIFKDFSPSASYLPAIIGLLLISMGSFYPKALKGTYRIWMGAAFTIGWTVSRVMLIILFYLVITPIGLIARLFRKEFIDLKMKRPQDSYWVRKNNGNQVNYEKMY